MSSLRTKLVTATAVGAAAIGGATVANAATSGSSTTGTTAASTTAKGTHTVNGKSEQALTGTTAAKVKAAALAKYPGTIQDIQQVPDGSYVAHVIRPDKTELHVLVSKAFKVTGTRSGPPGGGPGGPGGFGQGTPVVGPDAAKVKAAALAKYPGTIQQIQRRPDGSYVAHVIRPDKTEVHVLVSKAFKVTGVLSGPPGGGPAGPPTGQAPA
jgi:hypothetical protein